MTKKTGKQAKYITHKINGQHEVEVKDIVNGYEMGVAEDKTTGLLYTMIPKALLPKDARRSKKVSLKSDKANAVAKFYAITAELKGDNNIITIKKEDTDERKELALDKPVKQKAGVVRNGKVKVSKQVRKITVDNLVDIPESYCIEWLKRELQNPKALAKKTGIEAFNNFRDWMLKTNITLAELYTNYKGSIRYSKIKHPDTKTKTKAAWELFLTFTDAVNVDAVTQDEVKAFERYLHDKEYADKYINHFKNNVTKIFRYNFEKFYVGNTDIQQVLSYFASWEQLDINGSSTISAQVMSKKDFETLYNAADAKGDLLIKAVIMLCLNTGTYIREVARFKRSDIDFDEQTLATQRNKRGRCQKFAYLWNRTVKDLKAYLATRKDSSDVLFLARHGAAYKGGEGIRTNFWKLRDNNGLGAKELGDNAVEFNHLRDTFQTLADEQGVTAFHSNMVMGHSTGRTKERYSHRRIHNELKVACEKVEKAFFGSVSKTPAKKKATKKAKAK